MITKKIHYLSGIILAIFIGFHLFNHLYSITSIDKHIKFMNLLRIVYRNIFVETILLLAIFTQIISGLRLFKTKNKIATSGFDKLHIWSGFYLAVFLIIHLAAVFGGRYFLHLDTNFYFGAAGLNSFPLNLFFLPYYGLAIVSVFGHLASVHNNKMKQSIFGLTPGRQAAGILIFGIGLTIAILYGLTNHFTGAVIPKDYHILIGK